MTKTNYNERRLIQLEAQFYAAVLRNDSVMERLLLNEIKAFANTSRPKPPQNHADSYSMVRPY